MPKNERGKKPHKLRSGDIQLTILQTVALFGAIIVTTPQDVALIEFRR